MMHHDVAVIGGGQAGLATARLLANAGSNFVVLDAEDRVGGAWRRRYEGLTLFTTREFSALGGMSMPGDPNGYPGKDEFADYLEAYVDRFRIPLRSKSRAKAISKDGDGRFRVVGDGFDPFTTDAVVMAVGGFRDPIVPSWAKASDIIGIAADRFGDGRDLPSGPLLVVGDGASGRDIAMTKAPSRKVVLAVGRQRRLLPERIAGRSLWWWLRASGLMRAPASSFIGKRMRAVDPFPDRRRSIRDLVGAGVEVRPRAVSAEGNVVLFEDGSTLKPSAIVWAIGYHPDWSMLKIHGALDGQGKVVHQAGISPAEGLYFVGLPWQRNRASGLVMGVSDDAETIVKAIVRNKR